MNGGIALRDDREVRAWSRAFGCSPEQLIEAVMTVGNRPEAILRELGR